MHAPSSPTIHQLQAQLTDPDVRERLRAIRALAATYPDQAGPELVTALEDKSAQVRQLAAEKLGGYKNQQATQPLRALLFDRSTHVRLAAAWALCRLGVDRSQVLLDALLDSSQGVREHAAKALGALDDSQILPHLQDWLNDSTRPVTVEIVRLVGTRPDQHTAPALLHALQRVEGYSAREELLKYLRWPGYLQWPDDERVVDGLLEAARANPSLDIGEMVQMIVNQSQGRDESVAKHFLRALHGSQHPEKALVLAVEALNRLRFWGSTLAEEAALALVAALRHEEKELRESIFQTLRRRQEQLRGNERILAALRPFLASSEPEGPYYAALLLGYFGDEQAFEPLLHLLREHINDEKDRACLWVIDALGASGDRRALEPLLHLLSSPFRAGRREHWDRALWLLVALGQLKDARAVEPLTRLLNPRARSFNECVYQEHLVKALVQIGDARAVRPLLQVLNSHPGAYDEMRLQERQLEALGQFRSKQAVEPLLCLLDPCPHSFEEQQFQRALLVTLGRLKDGRIVDPLLRLLDPQMQTTFARGDVIQALGGTGEPRVFELLVKLVDPQGTDASEQQSLAVALYKLGGARARKPLRSLLGHPHYSVRNAAQWCLEELKKEEKEPDDESRTSEALQARVETGI